MGDKVGFASFWTNRGQRRLGKEVSWSDHKGTFLFPKVSTYYEAKNGHPIEGVFLIDK